jgi:hypothetical protein
MMRGADSKLVDAVMKNKTKLARLGTVAAITAAITLSYFFYTGGIYATRRCWQAAPSILSCYQSAHFDFVTDLYGMRWEGNTANLIDRYILY